MAVVSHTIDLAATGGYVLSGYTTASKVRTLLQDTISDSSSEFELPREIRLPARDFQLFLVALEENVEPSPKLLKAAEAFKQKHR
jgi:hypothetical protein